MEPAKLLQRFLLPGFVTALIYAFRFRALVSPRVPDNAIPSGNPAKPIFMRR